jgi:hypothetical protein
MPVFNPRLDVRPDSFGFSGAPRDRSFVRSRFRGPFSSAEEAELALELLQVTSETQFDRFLDNLFNKVWGGGIARVGSKVTGPLRGLLKTVASGAAFRSDRRSNLVRTGERCHRWKSGLACESGTGGGSRCTDWRRPRFGELPAIVREAPAIRAIGWDGRHCRGSGIRRGQPRRGGAEKPGGFSK